MIAIEHAGPAAVRAALAAALLACGSPATLPVITGPVLLTDVEAGHGSTNAQSQATSCTRVGDSLYCVYKSATDALDPDDRDGVSSLYIREIDLAQGRVRGAAVPVMPGVVADDLTAGHVHRNPSLTHDANGALVALWSWGDPRSARVPGVPRTLCAERPDAPSAAPCFGLWQQVLPDLRTPGRWEPPGGVPSRVHNTFGWQTCEEFGGDRADCGWGCHDVTCVEDERSGCSYCTCESAGRGRGFGRALFKVCGDARRRESWDGPWLVVQAGQFPWIELGSPRSRSRGNVFTKGQLRLGREREGARSLHLAWTRHNRFTIENRPGDGTCAGDADSDDDDVQWDFDVMYAVSDDGGVTWHSFDGATRTPAGRAILWNDDRYRIWEGETEQSLAYSWDLDLDGRPVFALLEAASGTYKGDRRMPGRWHIDQSPCNRAGADAPVRYDLKLLRYDPDAGGWTTRSIEQGCNCPRLGVHVALNGDLYVLREQPPRYNVSRDGGESWEGWTRFDDPHCSDYADPHSHCNDAWRLQLIPDPRDPRDLHVIFQSRGSRLGSAEPAEHEHRRVVDSRYHWVRLRTSDGGCGP